MANNVSVERFKKLLKDLQQEVHDGAVAELNSSADAMVSAMELAAPRGASGNLEHSVRKIPGKADTQVRIVAGGQTTRRPEISNVPFDYARADEFGTVHMAARPFFWPTYRLLKPKMVASMRRKITAAIKKRSAE